MLRENAFLRGMKVQSHNIYVLFMIAKLDTDGFALIV